MRAAISESATAKTTGSLLFEFHTDENSTERGDCLKNIPTCSLCFFASYHYPNISISLCRTMGTPVAVFPSFAIGASLSRYFGASTFFSWILASIHIPLLCHLPTQPLHRFPALTVHPASSLAQVHASRRDHARRPPANPPLASHKAV